MEITLQYFASCRNWKVLDHDLGSLLGEMGLSSDIQYQLVETPEEAVEHDFHGSPTVRINGVDPFADVGSPVGLSCRIYRTEAGSAGSPSREQLAKALQDAGQSKHLVDYVSSSLGGVTGRGGRAVEGARLLSE